MVTLKDIAGRCSVSVATVSKALSGAHDVGTKTAEHIRAVARQMEYYPNAAARSLKTNRSHNIGILFQEFPEGDFSHEHYADVFANIRRALGKAGYDLTFICRDVSLVGFNGVAMSKRISPTIFTSMPDTTSLGAQTVRLLLQAIEGSPEPPEHILVPGVIFAGQTLGKHK